MTFEPNKQEKFRDTTLTIRQRVDDLLGRMTLDEKIAQLRQDLYGWKCYLRQGDQISFTDYLENYLEQGQGVGCLYGLFRADPWSQVNKENGIPAALSLATANRLQKKIMSSNRFGIPALFVEEAPHGHQALGGVSYPVNLGKGNSFDPDLFEQMAEQIRNEMMAKGVHLALVSTLDLARDPRWGRTEECLSEDGVISAEYTEAIVKGFQGDLISDQVNYLDHPVPESSRSRMGVVLKHLIGQGDALGGHNSGSSVIGRRELLDVYWPLIHAARNAAGVMAAYNDIDGVPCHGNAWLLDDLLRKQAGFQGLIMSDGVALDRLATNYTKPGLAARQALTAGIQENLWDHLYPHLHDYVQAGLVSEALINRAAFRVLSLKFLLGLFDHPFAQPTEFDEAQAQRVNLHLAEESITLLKNDGILPLKSGKKIAVIGPNANSLYNLLGDYTAPQQSEKFQTIFTALKTKFFDSTVKFAQGCAIRDHEGQPKLCQEAVTLATASDVVILALGGSSTRNFGMQFENNGAISSKGVNMDSGENVDLSSLALGGEQLTLLDQIKRLGKPIITVMVQGRPYELEAVLSASQAVLVAWYPGQRGGEAVANVISGAVAPTGRLSLSYPRSVGQLPVYGNQHRNPAPAYYDSPRTPLFSLGAGLSYGVAPSLHQVTIVPASISVNALATGNVVKVMVEVENTQSKPATQTLIVSTTGLTNNVVPREGHIVAFKRVTLNPAETRVVVFTLGHSAFEQTGFDFKPRLFQGSVSIKVNGAQTNFEITSA